MAAQQEVKHSVLPSKLGGGPKGLGDPDDKSLRRVEIEVLIPKKMREIAKSEKCVNEVQDFLKCCKESSLSMVIFCRKENDVMKSCLTKWYLDEEFKQRCTNEYLQERSEYRRTGIPQKQKQLKS